MALPAPTVLAAVTQGYIPTGRRRYSFVTAIANPLSPTSAELSAGSDLTNLVAATSGFSGTGATIDLPNAGSRWTPKVPGLISADDSSVTLNMSATGTDGRALFNDGSDGTTPTAGFFVIYYEGITSTGKMRVFPVQVTSVQASSDIAAVATVDVMFSIMQPPSNSIAIPTA